MIKKQVNIFFAFHQIGLMSTSISIYNIRTAKKVSGPVNFENVKGDIILKNYFNKRLDMSDKQIIDLVQKLENLKVTRKFFNDHRWLHLNMLLQKNLAQLSIQQMFQILSSFNKLKAFNHLYQQIIKKILEDLQTLLPSEKSIVFYYMAKTNKLSVEKIRALSDSLLLDLNKNIKIEFKKSINFQSSHQQKQGSGQEQAQYDLGHIFNNQIEEPMTVDGRDLILCLWSLQKMKIKDALLMSSIIKSYLKPNISKMPASIFPLLLSTLWLHKMQNKRFFNEITLQILNREKQLICLDQDKLKMIICMLCKPQITKLKANKNQKIATQTKLEEVENEKVQEDNRKKEQEQKKSSNIRAKAVLWLMQTLLLRHENKIDTLTGSSAYQILSNASQAKIVDFQLYQKYLAVICEDPLKIEARQFVYLLFLIQKIRYAIKKSMNQRKEKEENSVLYCQKQLKMFYGRLKNNLISFFNNHNEQHEARHLLRKMVISKFISFSRETDKKLIHQENQQRKKSINKKEPRAQSKQGSLEKQERKQEQKYGKTKALFDKKSTKQKNRSTFKKPIEKNKKIGQTSQYVDQQTNAI